MSHKTVYWFKAKRYGYGWGLPCSWRGWAFFVPWLLLCLITVRELAVRRNAIYTAALALETLVLVLVCYWKGEPLPPRDGPPTSPNR
jgi:hypothetical protein